jgi:hypothetical protein
LRQSNPLKSQTVAIRGFRTFDDSIPIQIPPDQTRVITALIPANAEVPPGGVVIGVLRNPRTGNVDFLRVQFTEVIPGQATAFFPAGTFFGSGVEALNVDQLTGQDSWQPGFKVGLGWKFRDGSSLSLNWSYLTSTQYRAGATLAPQNAAVGVDLADSFLYADVFNIPPEYAGPDGKVGVGSPTVAFGIWNGASIMTESFRQRFQEWDLTYRWTVWDTEDYRFNGLVGPKFAWFWEKYRWDTTSLDPTGNTGPQDVGIYTNITSNRMYGVFIGCQNECYLGHGFALMLDTRASILINSVKERAKYELGDRFAGLPENKRAKREFTVVPELQASLGLWWYPTEAIQVYFGYDFMVFFNTLASRRPIDFDYSNLAPKWSSYTRWLDGFSGGFAFHF